LTNQEILNSLNEKIKAAEEALLYLEQSKAGIERVIANSVKPETLYEICKDWYGDGYDYPEITVLVDRIEAWLPKEQSAKGSQNVYVECTVEGFNDCLNQIKSKLRRTK
jgi:hypothetical protein